MTNAKKIRYFGYGCSVFLLFILLTLSSPMLEAAGLRETLLDEVGVQTGAARKKLLSLKNAAEIKKYTAGLRPPRFPNNNYTLPGETTCARYDNCSSQCRSA